MRKLDHFWAALNRLRDWTLTLPHWRQELGKDFEPVRGLLRRTQGRAATYPCQGFEGYGCPMEIIEHGDGSIIAICGAEPRRCERKVLAVEDTILYDLNLQRLAEEIGRALGFTVTVEEMPVGRCWSLGMRIDAGGATEQVYLACEVDEEDFAHSVAALVADGGKGFTLLTPTGSDLPVSAVQRLRRLECRLLALNQLLFLSEGGRLEKVPDSLGPGLRKDHQPGQKVPAAVFRKEGRIWHVAFGGDAGSVSHRVGMIYLSEILRRPYNVISSVELVQSRSGLEIAPLSGTVAADQQAIQEYKKEAYSLGERIQKAREDNDPAQVKYLSDELQRILAHVKRVQGWDGKPRLERADRDKRRKSVLAAVTAAKAEIAAQVPLLSKHLDDYVDGGYDWLYRPPQEIEWRF